MRDNIHTFFETYIERAQKSEALLTAVVHPVTEEALLGAVEASKAGLIQPVLIGPQQKIKHVAKDCDISIDDYKIIDCPHSHAAAKLAVAMGHRSEIGMIMKGSLHTDELMQAIVDKNKGITTERKCSHAFVLDVPTYPRPMIISDAAINITPDLSTKRDIVQNAIDLAIALGIETPHVAILAAVETINPKMPSTLDAAALCKMSERQQIQGGVLDGPLAFDNAISAKAAKMKEIESRVTGKADIFIAPDLEAGNMLAKQLEYLAKARIAGVVLGCKLPVVLTSRADNSQTRMTSCAIAILYAAYQQDVLRKKNGYFCA